MDTCLHALTFRLRCKAAFPVKPAYKTPNNHNHSGPAHIPDSRGMSQGPRMHEWRDILYPAFLPCIPADASIHGLLQPLHTKKESPDRPEDTYRGPVPPD